MWPTLRVEYFILWSLYLQHFKISYMMFGIHQITYLMLRYTVIYNRRSTWQLSLTKVYWVILFDISSNTCTLLLYSLIFWYFIPVLTFYDLSKYIVLVKRHLLFLKKSYWIWHQVQPLIKCDHAVKKSWTCQLYRFLLYKYIFLLNIG